MKTMSRIYTGLILLFLFAPILILIIYSFNGTNSTAVMSGFSLQWYAELFHNSNILEALRNKYLHAALDTVTNIPMINPDIITGISLMLMFVFAGRLFGLNNSLNFATILIAHVTFCLPYVILQVMPKLQQMDKSLPEAAMDLGCTHLRAFFKVEIPELFPGILTGMIMAFTMSLDDFVISYFTSGPGFQTLPVLIYSMTKKTVKPTIYALATIIFFVILALLTLTNLIDSDTDKAVKEAKKKKKLKKQAAA